jgi:hypothetical protein
MLQDFESWGFCLCFFLGSYRIHRSHSPTLIAVRPSISTFYCKPLNIFIKVCYASPVVAMLPRHAPPTFLHLIPTRVAPTPKSHRIISFADPHPLTFLKSYRFKKGRGGAPSDHCAPIFNHSGKSFSCNTYGPSRKYCKQRIYGSAKSQVSLVDATLTRNRGRGLAIGGPEITSPMEFNPRALAGSSGFPKLSGDSQRHRLCESFRPEIPLRVSQTGRCRARA